MAGRGLGTLTLDLAVKTGGFEQGLDRAGRALDRRLSNMEKRASAFGKILGAALVAGATAAAYSLKSAIDSMDELSKSAQKFGVSTEALSRLAYAADLSDVSLEQLQGGMAKLTKFQAEAAQGNKEAIRSFKELKIAYQDGGGLRDSQKVFEDLAAIFAKLPDGATKTALALQFFGRSGAELIPLLNSGADGLRDMAAEADRLGVTLSTEAGKQAEEFNDDLTRLQAQMDGMIRKIATGLLPELSKLADALQGSSVGAGDSFIDWFIKDTAELSKAIRHVVVEIEFLKKAWKEQGVFGEGIFSVLKKAEDEFNRREGFAESRKALGVTATHGRGSAASARELGRQDLASRQAAEAAAKIFTPTEGGGGKSKARSEADELADSIKRMNEQMAETIALYNQTGEAAKVRYSIEHGELAKASKADQERLLLQAQRIDQLAAEKKAREEGIRLEEEEAEEAKRHSENIKELLDDIAFETSLTKLSNDEKERAILLRRNLAGATEEEAKRITAATDEMLAAQKSSSELSGAMDEFRANFEDTVVDVVTGAKSISEAFKSLADAVVAQIARIIAQQLTTSLFGAPGATAGGSSGGLLSSIFSIFLPKHAAGTDFAPGGPSIVGEHGPELVNLPRGSQVIPNHRLKPSGDFYLTVSGGRDPRETAMQSGRELRRQLAFSGRS